MLAKIDWNNPPCEPQPVPEYSGFPLWHALLVEPNRERWSAEALMRVNVHVYLALYQISYFRCGVRRTRQKPVIPGLLFVPTEYVDIPRRDEVFKWARVHGFMRSGNGPSRVTKADVERIRVMEGKLNRPDEPCDVRGKPLEVGQEVRFLDPKDWNVFGDGIVVEVASFNRIGVETRRLFGRAITIYTPSSEIEVL